MAEVEREPLPTSLQGFSAPSCARCGGALGPPAAWTWTADNRVLCVVCAPPRAKQFG